jgi:outer membrane protein TolC
MPRNRFLVAAAALAMMVGLGGCVSLTGDGGMAPVREIALSELNADAAKLSTEPESNAAAERVAALLRRPLTAGSAVQIALLNNRGLQAAYNGLGISEAQYVQASLPPSPRFDYDQLVGDFEVEIVRRVAANILALATLPARSEIARNQFRAAQLRAAQATLTLAAEARRQFYRAAAANEQVALLGRTADRDPDAGAELIRARTRLRTERERLTRLLGLWTDDYKLPARLPALPARIRSAREAEAEALQRRLDLQIARIELEALARSYGLTQATRFITDLELAAQNKYKSDDKYTSTSVSKTTTITDGFVVSFEIPLFDFGQARVTEAEQRYLQAANKLAEMAVNARSEAREAYHAYRGTYELARHYQTRTARPSYAQASTSDAGQDAPRTSADLPAWAREAQAVDARRDFWVADTDLNRSLIGGTSGGTGPSVAPRS